MDQNQDIISELKNMNICLRDIEKHLGKITKCLDKEDEYAEEECTAED